jgi:hypothetical protein
MRRCPPTDGEDGSSGPVTATRIAMPGCAAGTSGEPGVMICTTSPVVVCAASLRARKYTPNTVMHTPTGKRTAFSM